MKAPKQVNVHEAKTKLSQLLAEVEAGREIIVARNGKPVARLVPFQPEAKKKLRLGQWSLALTGSRTVIRPFRLARWWTVSPFCCSLSSR